MKNLRKMLVFFQIALEIDFQWILERFWCQFGRQNGAKIYRKGGWENDEKMMMTRIAKKLDIGGHDCARHPCPEPRGGGRRRAKPLLQYSKKHWMKELGDGCWHATQRAGGILTQNVIACNPGFLVASSSPE